MPEDHDNRGTRSAQQQKEENVSFLEPALWRTLNDAQSDQEFCLSWLELQSHMIIGTTSGLVGFGSVEAGTFAPVAFYPRGLQERKHFAGVVEQVFKERKGIVLRNDGEGDALVPEQLRLLVGYPIWVDGELDGVVALELLPRPSAELQAVMRQLQWGSAWLQKWLMQKQAEPQQQIQSRLETALELTICTLDEKSYQAAAMVAVTELAMRLECDRVSVGFLQRHQAKVSALSHSAQFGKQMNLVQSIAAAMDEAMDQGQVVIYPPSGTGPTAIVRAHSELAEQLGDTVICTVPFVNSEGDVYGALTFERSGSTPFDAELLELCETAADVLGPILEEKRLNDRHIFWKLAASGKSLLSKFIGPEHMLYKLVFVLLLALVIFFSFATGDYRVTAKAALEGQVQRAVVAPFRGYLFSADVRAGDVVREGQLLASLDDRDLRLERNKWASQRAQHQLEYRRKMAEGDTAAANISQEQAVQAKVQLTMLDEQISRARILAPFDGIVVTGDLSQALGSPVEIGDTLFEVAPLDRYRLKLQVDEREIDQVRLEQTGALILNALPELPLPFTVSKITPVSLAEEGQNFFVVEATLDEFSERLRPRMEGFGKITIGEQKLIWIWTHKMIDWVRLWVWTWWP
ncbi:MAG: hypothetical protein C0619_02190 [Desulfuromonas sp.]|nr:MAG: hypothetical protein C0619_02190 [Desulfuromonas sp.]